MSTPPDKDDRRGELTVSRVVDKPSRLVFIEPDTGITVTITFDVVGDKTEVTIHQVGVPERFLGPEAEAGFAATFDKLEALLDQWTDG